tara:strand:- start:674 stop:1363 length:690 start_codon:yes stop_codon:yes gene_type:complete
MPDDKAGPEAYRQMLSRGHAYVVPCASTFRDRVMSIAKDRGVSVGDLVRSVLMLVPAEELERTPDPGEPMPDDREVVEVISGPSKGRVLRRKPRLQLWLIAGYGVPELRRALAVALDLTEGVRTLALEPAGSRRLSEEGLEEADGRLAAGLDELRQVIETIALQPLEKGVTSRGEALHVLGFSPYSRPKRDLIRSRYRQLARIYHPDASFGDHVRMSLLNQAMDRLIPY